jgi:cephalosporin hydroxylase
LAQIRQLASRPTDIDEHLELIYTEALLARPAVIVELGVRGGTSTFIFERVANSCRSHIVSVDIEDCSAISSHPRWHFYQGDDVQFAAQFQEFCRTRNIPPAVDLLSIDTSHIYEHTVQEIRAWFPLLSQPAKVMFHDTNLKLFGPRRDGCFAISFDNQRGVVRAIENFLNVQIQEHRQWVDSVDGWLIRHWPNCNGFTILDRIPAGAEPARPNRVSGQEMPANLPLVR